MVSERHLLARGGAVRDGDRPAPVLGRHPGGGGVQARAGTPTCTPRGEPRGPPGPRGDHLEVSGQVPRPPLCHRRRSADRPAPLPRGACRGSVLAPPPASTRRWGPRSRSWPWEPRHYQALAGDDVEGPAEPSRTKLYAAILALLLVALAVVIIFLGNSVGWWHIGEKANTSFVLPTSPTRTSRRQNGLCSTED